jgi:mono/diheme cytochrome c family protein
MKAVGIGLLAAGLALAACGSPTSGKSAEELWSEHCQRCHGADGRGRATQRELDPGLDLTASPMVAKASRGLVFQRIAYGYGTMPGFAHKLELGDLELLTEFVLRLHRER